MPRDNFSKSVIERLSKRVGMKCSRPDCRLPTAGPNSLEGVTNVGVAAHITAASPDGPRFDNLLTSEERAGIANGIWLCQTDAKLIDDDEIAYTTPILREWKETAEHMAALEARGYAVRKAQSLADLEKKAPNLIAEMRDDLKGANLVREFVLLNKGVMYSNSKPNFVYYYGDHKYLDSVITIMQHVGAIYDITFNSVPRYNFTEEFVSFLIGDQGG